MKPARRRFWNQERQRQQERRVVVHVCVQAEAGDTSALRLLLQQLNTKVDAIMATQAEIVEQLARAEATLVKVGEEISGLQVASDALATEVARLTDIISGMGSEASAELIEVAASIEAAATALDEKIPDAPEIPPEEGNPLETGSGSTSRSP